MTAHPTAHSKDIKTRFVQAADSLGPGLVTGAADDDPSGIATYSQAGAQFGYGLLWTMVLTYPLMCAIQLISAHIGRVTGAGLARNLTQAFPRWLVVGLVGILLLANVINIGADLAAMAAAVELLIGGPTHVMTIAFAVIVAGLQVFVPYRPYARVLKWLTLSLFAYVGVLLVVHTDWSGALRGMVWPTRMDQAAITTFVAVLGTTISPYLFFWQSAQEVEELDNHPRQHRLLDAPKAAPKQFRRMRLDTFVGMAFSNLVALAIMIATADTLHLQGITQIDTAAQAAEALRPVAGSLAFLLFAIGIIGTGLLAIPVLAGSAAFAITDTAGWGGGLQYAPTRAKRFYAIIVIATLAGVLIDWTNTNPIKALYWSAVLNGVAAVPLMVATMVVATRPAIMGKFTASPMLRTAGWAATAVMSAASLFFFYTLLT
jgi:NRAMP (natural resistance-associated macrophage protein)-like metal ion transporter